MELLFLDGSEVEIEVLLADSNQDDGSAEACGIDAVLEGGGEADSLDADVETASVGLFHDAGEEVLVGVVEDCVVDSELLLGHLELVLRYVGHDDSGAFHFGGGCGEDSDCAGADYQNTVAFLELDVVDAVKADAEGPVP